MRQMGMCPLCGRDGVKMSDHHLVPRSRGGRDTEAICNDCHSQIHALYTNKRLEEEFGSVESLLSDESFQKFLKWVAKKPPGRRYKARRAKGTRRRGRGG